MSFDNNPRSIILLVFLRLEKDERVKTKTEMGDFTGRNYVPESKLCSSTLILQIPGFEGSMENLEI